MPNDYEDPTMEDSMRENALGPMEEAIDEHMEKTAEINEEYLLSEFSPVETSSSSRSDGCTISIVNTSENGKRIKLSKMFMKILGAPETLQFKVSNDGTRIVMAEKIPGVKGHYKVSKSNVYCGPLVDELTKQFNLDFSNRTSISFPEDQILDLTSGKAIIFKII